MVALATKGVAEVGGVAPVLLGPNSRQEAADGRRGLSEPWEGSRGSVVAKWETPCLYLSRLQLVRLESGQAIAYNVCLQETHLLNTAVSSTAVGT